MEIDGKTEEITLRDEPFILEPFASSIKLILPGNVIYQVDHIQNINLKEYLTDEESFFTVTSSNDLISMGEEGQLRIVLDHIEIRPSIIP